MGGFTKAVNSAGLRRSGFGLIILALFSLLILLFSSGTAFAASSKIISTTATGGDCASIGTWNAATKTCTLTTDVIAAPGSNGIEIINDGVTLDGAGHAVYGSGGNATGGSLSVRNGITIKNLTVSGFNYGIFLQASNNNTLHDNIISNNACGIYLVVSNNNRIYNNNFIGNTTQANVSSSSGNLFDVTGHSGNYWSNYDTPAEGCVDDNGDYMCDAAYTFTGGSDLYPWRNASAWNVTPPPDTTPPTVSSVLPSGTIGSGAATVAVYYSDTESSVDLATVAVYLDGSALTGCDVSQTRASCAVSGLATGPHSITGSLADNAGNVAAIIGSFSFIDSAAPVVSSIQPAGTLATGSATISAYYSDGGGSGIDSASAAVYLDGARVSGCGATATGITCLVTGLSQGDHAITVSVDDISGNTGTGSGGFKVDTIAPAIGVVAPSGTVSSSTVSITVDYSDTVSGVNTSVVMVTLDGTALGGCSITAASASCPVSSLALGGHTIGGSVSDNAGNTSPVSGSFDFVDNVAPSVSGITPSGTVNTDSVTIGVNYSDGSGSGIDSATVSVYLDGSALAGCNVGAGSASCAVYVANGSHSIEVGVDDNAGNHGSGSGSFTVDTTAPEITPTINIRDNTTGGDCMLVGTWDAASKICTLTKDLNFDRNGIQIVGNGITLDGGGHTITGAGAVTSGGSVALQSGITIRNLKIRNFGYGIYLQTSSNNTVTGNFITENTIGIRLSSSSNNRVYENDFVGNGTQAVVSGGSGNVFDQANPGGNYWSDFDTADEGCTDADADGFCDAPRLFNGGQDNKPLTAQYGWIGGPAPVKPDLRISVNGAFWGSYADYLARDLSVRATVSNNGGIDARNVTLTGSASTDGVSITTALPYSIGDIAAGASSQFVLHYNVPTGVTRWLCNYTASAEDAAGIDFTYP